MNYTTITINEETIGLKFGMASFRYLQEKFQNDKNLDSSVLNEITISHIIYSGYFNNCIVKEVDPKYKFADIVEWVEQTLLKNQEDSEIAKAINVWSGSDFIKQGTVDQTKKNELSWEEIEAFAFGELKIIPREFYGISPRELSLMFKGHESKRIDEYKQTRMLMFTMVRLMGDPKTAPKTPEALWQLPGDEEVSKIDEEEYREIFKRLSNG